MNFHGIRSIYLHNFRSYSTFILENISPVVVITGENGTGKTNLLEAVSLLSPSKGLRKSKLHDLKNFSSIHEDWGVSVNLTHKLYGDMQCGVGNTGGENAKKLIRINAETLKKQNDISQIITQIWLTPSMDRFVVDSPSSRREFIDHVTSSLKPNHDDHLTVYEVTLKERSKLLKEHNPSPIWLKTLEQKIAELGVLIVSERFLTLDYLRTIIQTYLTNTGFPEFSLIFTGDLDHWIETSTQKEAEERFKDILAMNRDVDSIRGGSTIGPHRSDLIFHFSPKNIPGHLCSTGEQKILILGLILSCIKLLELRAEGIPILLLDEVIAHLDQHYREILFDQILKLKVQTWMTGIEKETFAYFKNNATFYET